MPAQKLYKEYLTCLTNDADRAKLLAQLEQLAEIAIEAYYANKQSK